MGNSTASFDAQHLLDKVHARFVAQRLPPARTMLLTINGRYRTGDHEWDKHHSISIHDGAMVEHDEGGDRGPDELTPEDLVNSLDIMLKLPETEKGSDAFTGTLTVDGHTRPIAVRFPDAWLEGDHEPIQTALRNWWWINHRL